MVLSQPLKVDPNHLGFARTMNKKKLLTDMNRIINKGYKSGEIQRIIKRHLPHELQKVEGN